MPDQELTSFWDLLKNEEGLGCTSLQCGTCGGLFNRPHWARKRVIEYVTEQPIHAANQIRVFTPEQICSLPYWEATLDAALGSIFMQVEPAVYRETFDRWIRARNIEIAFVKVVIPHVLPLASSMPRFTAKWLEKAISHARDENDAGLMRSLVVARKLVRAPFRNVLESATEIALSTRDSALILDLLRTPELGMRERGLLFRVSMELALQFLNLEYCLELIDVLKMETNSLQAVLKELVHAVRPKDTDLILALLRFPELTDTQRYSLIEVSLEVLRDTENKTFALDLLSLFREAPNRVQQILSVMLPALENMRDAAFLLDITRSLGDDFGEREELINTALEVAIRNGDGFIALAVGELSIREGQCTRAFEAATQIAYHNRLPSLINRLINDKRCADDLKRNLIDLLWESARSGDAASRRYLYDLLVADDPKIGELNDLKDRFDPVLPTWEDRETEAKNKKQRELQMERSKERQNIIDGFSNKLASERLKFIAYSEHSINYYPCKWAEVEEQELRMLDDATVENLEKKLTWAHKGSWRVLKRRVRDLFINSPA